MAALLALQHCGECGYALRGLPDGRVCPECGNTRDPQEIVLFGWNGGGSATLRDARPCDVWLKLFGLAIVLLVGLVLLSLGSPAMKVFGGAFILLGVFEMIRALIAWTRSRELDLPPVQLRIAPWGFGHRHGIGMPRIVGWGDDYQMEIHPAARDGYGQIRIYEHFAADHSTEGLRVELVCLEFEATPSAIDLIQEKLSLWRRTGCN